MRGIAVVVVAGMALANCAGVPSAAPVGLMPDGPHVASPAGWVDYCRRTPADPACGIGR